MRPSGEEWPARQATPASSERGTALLMILLALFAIGLMSMVVAQVASTEVAISSNITASTTAFLPADGASQVLLHDVVAMSRQLGRFPTDAELATIAAPPYDGVTLTEFTALRNGAEIGQPLTSGLYVGLSALVQPFTIVVTAEAPGPPESRATVEIGGEFAAIPIFQLGVLYEHELDVHPGPPMTLAGRIHSNAGIWLDPGTSLDIDAPVTTDGGIYNGRRDGSFAGGTVRLLDSQGVYQGLAGLDSDDPDWSAEAIDRWDGRVRSDEIGGDRLELVMKDPGNPRLLIVAGRPDDTAADQAAKHWYEAELRIVNGRGYDSDGNQVSLVDPVTGESALRETVLYDHREMRHMLTVEVDMEKLGRSPGYPANGIVYAGAFEPVNGMPAWPGGALGVGPPEWETYATPWSGTGETEFAIKLTNGDTLPGPVSVVSENPTYVQGDFNTVNKTGAAVMADAVTLLSNRWGDVDGDGDFDSDLLYSELTLADRDATSTTVNAALMTGNVDMGTQYNGGLENLPRFLENWSGVTLTIRGSLVALWRSQIANAWFGNSGVYSAPTRDWSFDTDLLQLANLPPGTPRIYKITVTSWDRR